MMHYSIENIEVNKKKKWNNLLTKTEILYYYNNNDNIHVSNGISGLIFVFVSKNSLLLKMTVILQELQSYLNLARKR